MGSSDSMVSVEHGLRVLVVDEDAQNRALLIEVLSGEGFVVEGAASGEAAAHALLDRAFALVVAEATMKGAGGLALARTIRERPESFELPLLLLSASPSPTLRRLALEAGASAYLEKPFRVFDLVDRVRRLIRPRRSSDGPPTLPAIRLRRARQDVLVDLPSGMSFRPALRRALGQLGPGEVLSLLLIRLDDAGPAHDRSAWTSLVGALADVLRQLADVEATPPRALFRTDDGELAWLSFGDRRPELPALLSRLLEAGAQVSSDILPVWIAGIVVKGPFVGVDADKVLRFGRSLLVRARKEGIAVLADEIHEDEIPDSRRTSSSNKKAESSRRGSSAPPRKPKQSP